MPASVVIVSSVLAGSVGAVFFAFLVFVMRALTEQALVAALPSCSESTLPSSPRVSVWISQGVVLARRSGIGPASSRAQILKER